MYLLICTAALTAATAAKFGYAAFVATHHV